jgi:hypothetical protein
MPHHRIAVPLSHFKFLPEIKPMLTARDPGVKFRRNALALTQKDKLVQFPQGYEVELISLSRFTDQACHHCPIS